MRRLHPDPAPVDATAIITGLGLGERAPDARPYVIANFVTSVDGRASVNGGSSGLGDAGDKQIFRTLRGCADAILAGTGTMATEGYGRLARDSTVVAVRAGLGLAPQPLAVTVTRSGTLPDFPLLDEPESELLVYSGAELQRPLTDARARVRVIRRAPAELTMSAVLADLRAVHGVRLLLCEGGPRILGQLIAESVLDELFLTVAGTLVGGDAGAITAGLALSDPRALALRWVLEQDGSLYLRYASRP